MGGIVKKQLRVLIIALILNPMVWAISEGPHQPEYAKFEPVDASDMVSLTTGDFVYNLPLFEVPGPNGGYPINLAYHAGINPNQEASWVGLGWSLNVGAINRQINGYPDDYNGDLIQTHIESTGRIRGHGIGIGVGWGPYGLNMDFEAGVGLTGMNASFGVPGVWDISIGTDGLGANVGFSKGGFGAGVSVRVGDNGFSAGIGVGTKYAKAYYQVGSHKPNFGVGFAGKLGNVKYMHHGGLSVGLSGSGIRISSSGISGTGFQVSMHSGASMSKNGIHQSYMSFGVPIPLPFGFSASFSYWEREVWIDETINELSYGYLAKSDYMADAWSKSSVDYRFDQQELGDNYIKNAQDSYSLNAWGISGQLLPHDLSENILYRTNAGSGNKNRLKQHESEENGAFLDNSEVDFIWLGDNGGYRLNRRSIDSGFEGDELINDDNQIKGTSIKTIYSDDELRNLVGFIITTADGKKYEFMDYTTNIYNYQFSTKPSEESQLGDIQSWTQFGSLYPVSWLLTGIKGPDYVDINGNDMDEEDFGFWVKFQYSNLEESYNNSLVYSNPYIADEVEFAPVAQSDAEKFLFGIKNRKYLKTIETATHEALFETSVRFDNRPANISSDYTKMGVKQNGSDYGGKKMVYIGEWKKYLKQTISDMDLSTLILSGIIGISIPTEVYDYRWVRNVWVVDDPETGLGHWDPVFEWGCYSAGYSLLTTNYLITLGELYNQDTGQFEETITKGVTFISPGNPCSGPQTYSGQILFKLLDNSIEVHVQSDVDFYSSEFFLYENLYSSSAKRLTNIKLFEKTTSTEVKSIFFDNDHYDLCPGTINSDAPNKGKLTLRGISFSGKDGKGHLPGYKFEYNNDPTYDHSQWHVDLWGRFNPDGVRGADNMQTDPIQRAKDVSMWSINKITTPSGAEINIEYESDVYSGEPDYYEMVNRTLRGNLLNTNSILSDYFEIGHTDLNFPLTTDYILLNANEASNINLNDKVYIFNYFFVMGAPVSSNKIYVKGNGFYNIINKFQLNSGNYAIQLNENIEINEGFGVFGYSYYLLDGGDVTKYIDGHRVKTISIFDPITNKKNETNYQYIYSQSQTGSGYSETMPVSFDERWDRKLSSLNDDGSGDDPEMLNWYDMPTFNSFDDDYFSLRTPPGILYGSVIVSTNNDDGKIAYEYYTPRDVKNSIEFTDNGLKIVNNSPIHGQLKKITHLKKVGDDTYRPEKVQAFNYAVSGEDIPDGFYALNDVAILKTKTGSSTDPMGQIREFNLSEVPNVFLPRQQIDITYNKFFMVGSRTEEYYYEDDNKISHSGVAEKVTKTYKFDFRTGQPLASGSYQSDGSFVAEETLPAYYIYDGEDALEDRNMLTQTAMHKTYKIKDAVIDGDLVDPLDMTFSDNKVMNATATTWKPWLVEEVADIPAGEISVNSNLDHIDDITSLIQNNSIEMPRNVNIQAELRAEMSPVGGEENAKVGNSDLKFTFHILDNSNIKIGSFTGSIAFSGVNELKSKIIEHSINSDLLSGGIYIKLVNIEKREHPSNPFTYSGASALVEKIKWSGTAVADVVTWLKNDTYAWTYGYGTLFNPFPANAWTDYSEYDYETDGKTAPDISGMDHWLQTSNITKYNRYSVPIEEQSAAGIYSSALYGYNDALPVAILANGRFSGEEDISGNATYIGFDHAIEGTSAHNHHWYLYPENDFSFDSYSGQFSRKIIPDDSDNTRFGPTRDILPEGESQNSKYIVTCWVKTESGFGSSNGRLVVHSKADGTDNTHVPSGAVQVLTFGDTNGQWEFKKLSFDLGQYKADAGITDNLRLRVYSVNNDGTKYFLIDDIRVYPADASMSTFTYDPVTWKVTTMTDANNLSTHYEYDDFGNLLRVLNHDKKVVSTGSKFSGREQ
jgi:YD repeat-containing protein